MNGTRTMPGRWRLFWLSVLTPHAVGAAAAIVLSPRGFPISHPQFFATLVMPIAMLALVVVALFAIRFRKPWMHLPLLVFPAAWITAAIICRSVFPISFRILFLPVLVGGIIMAIALWRVWNGRNRISIAIALLAAGMGATVPLLQRSPPPSTHPLNIAPPQMSFTDRETRLVQFSKTLSVQPSDGVINMRVGNVVLAIQPLLTFISRSPDRCWTIFAPTSERRGPTRELIGKVREEKLVRLAYADDGKSWLTVNAATDDTIDIEAITALNAPVYSHLNSFCEIGIFGHRRLSLMFSPCGDTRIEVQPMDYPVGRPQRSAYLGADGIFRVVEARSAEKGPFRELASGKLSRSEPLTITLLDQDQPLCTFTFDDFAAQASTTLSPTAGYGYPDNAIEFCRYGEHEQDQAAITITLGGTSVGRGYQSVGHSAGSYRNRMQVGRFVRVSE